jgi:hypothetical protein
MGVNSCGTTLIDQGVFKNIGAITWDTTVKTSGFTAVSGNGYFCNTTSAAFTVTLPASPSAGDVVAIADYANTFDTNNVTIGRNGSNIQGSADDFAAEIEGLSITLIYVDGTQGWLSIDAAQASDIISPQFVTATGGTITTSGDYKIHTFTSPGTFTVTQLGNAPTIPTGGPSNVDYLVVAGGGGGGFGNVNSGGVGGAGAGGYRTTFPSPGCNAGSFPITATGFPITVGGGGAGDPASGGKGVNGNPSIFSTITSSGGGGSASEGGSAGSTGGSGAGGSSFAGFNTGAAGNTPPVSPPQGNSGGNASGCGAGGGGGASAVGANSAPGNLGAAGGAGSANSINGSPVTRSGGGGGGAYGPPSPGFAPGGAGGAGGGGAGGPTGNPGTPGTVNTGGGGGGSGGGGGPTGGGGNGGSGIVIIRYKFQ